MSYEDCLDVAFMLPLIRLRLDTRTHGKSLEIVVENE